jgi:hypothetical protein
LFREWATARAAEAAALLSGAGSGIGAACATQKLKPQIRALAAPATIKHDVAGSSCIGSARQPPCWLLSRNRVRTREKLAILAMTAGPIAAFAA